MKTFKAILLTQEDKQTHAILRELSQTDLPEGDTLVKIDYSTLNYKDGLAVTGKGKIVREFPFVPGIDFVGTVLESESYKEGDKVILTGWGVGENHWGGFSQYARVKSEWLVPLPQGMSPQQAMSIGTAGFTAMLAIMALEGHSLPENAEIVVTGAGGGVGSIAIAILAHLGYQVYASTGRPQLSDYLQKLGAVDIIERSELDRDAKPMESSRWGGAIDAVGGRTLSTLLSTMNRGASIASIGLAGGYKLESTVYPFILRGVNLLGIDSVMAPLEKRLIAWQRLAQELPSDKLEAMVSTASLEDVPKLSEAIVAGDIRGRVVIDVNA